MISEEKFVVNIIEDLLYMRGFFLVAVSVLSLCYSVHLFEFIHPEVC